MTTTTCVLASQNAGKLREFSRFLAPFHLHLISQSDCNVTSVAETGLTFVENALLKARHVAHATAYPVIADDSGLIVPALQGAPGIYSARYAGDQADDNANNAKLLHALRDVSNEQRQAYFYCVIVYLQHANDPCPLICQGRWHGQILKRPQGHEGFGYDPLFYDPRFNCSAAEFSIQEKNKISHRGQALAQLIHDLRA